MHRVKKTACILILVAAVLLPAAGQDGPTKKTLFAFGRTDFDRALLLTQQFKCMEFRL